MKKLFFLLVFILILTSCTNTNLYSLKTEISNEENLDKLINSLDWNNNINKYEVTSKELTIVFDSEFDYFKTDLKPLLVNGIYLLILTDAEEIIYKNDVEYLFSLDKELTNKILFYQINKSIDDYKNNEEEIYKLEKFLKDLKVESGFDYFELK